MLEVAGKTLDEQRYAAVHGLGGSSPSFLAAWLTTSGQDLPTRPVLAVLPEQEEAEAFRDDCESILGEKYVRLFPERDAAPYEPKDSHFEVRSQRVETLSAIESGWKGIVVAPVGAVHDPTTPAGLIAMVSLTIRCGESINFDAFVRMLSSKGFKRVHTVSSAGEMSVRGGIIDVYSFGADQPYRIEFWGDEIESIRIFSTSSQRSVGKVDGFSIIPPDEFITEAGLNAGDEQRISDIERSCGIDLSRIRRAFDGGDRPNGVEQYLYSVFGLQSSLTRHFSEDSVLFITDPDRCMEQLKKRMAYLEQAWERQRNDEPNIPPPSRFMADPVELMDEFATLARVENWYLKPARAEVVDFGIRSSRQYRGSVEDVIADIRESLKSGMECHIACDNAGQADRIKDLFEEFTGDIVIDVLRLSGGFTDRTTNTVLLTDHEIFNRQRRRLRYRRYHDGMPIPDYRSLRLGDFVVHVDHGIGRFMGLKRIPIGKAEKDCLLVEYKGDDRLFIPIEQLRRLKKFTAEEGVQPVVSKLGGTAWEKLKERTRSSIARMAKDLLRLYAERKANPGRAFSADSRMLEELVESFVFEDTPDQLKSWEEVKKDLASESPMDRLICGDVGFGKTEIAVRAACMVVLGGYQAAVLVPTTILADQHEETFRERFADFPITVESISRFKSRTEQKEILNRAAAGKIDILIGTHRLLSQDVHFKKLGLLVIDEEQRFGVRHKEKLKTLKKGVDVLAMSATPIPRTLNMSLMGARDLSFITTAPPDRYSVHTEILPFEEKYVMEAVMREVDRGGQVYFVHNRVRSIQGIASYIKSLLPSVSFSIAHGQLPERELEKIIRDFHHGRQQVLVSTMIIENGIDIPSVNTIIINRADTFGLSQLYQLRGRVGRSNRRAFAYLLVPPKVPLSKIARQRLRIIEEFAELGSGFKIAMRDLEIRGAGNILGTEQSGFIAAVGFDLYTELLNETIAELKGEKVEKPPEVDLTISADMYLPESYIIDSGERVVFYRRLAEAVKEEELSEIEAELIDRFGRPKDAALNMIDAVYVRLAAGRTGIDRITVDDGNVTMFISQGMEISRSRVEKMVQMSPVQLRFSFEADGMIVTFRLPGKDGRELAELKNILQNLSQ